MKAGVQRFAPHVQDIEATLLESPDLAQALRRVDIVVYATGSERVVGMLRPGAPLLRIPPYPRSARDRPDPAAHAGDVCAAAHLRPAPNPAP